MHILLPFSDLIHYYVKFKDYISKILLINKILKHTKDELLADFH
jgi:hypothetical protein